MKTEEMLSRLERARPSGGGWMSLCPAHEDRSPSLSIAEGQDGRILLHCFAGCSIEAILGALGLSMRDLFLAPLASRQPKPYAFWVAGKIAAELQGRLTKRERTLPVTIVLAATESIDAAIARALALAIEGELVQIVLRESRR